MRLILSSQAKKMCFATILKVTKKLQKDQFLCRVSKTCFKALLCFSFKKYR